MKNFFKAAAVAAIVAFAGVNVFNANQDVQLSDLQMENVEALADGEYNHPTNCRWEEEILNCTQLAKGNVCLNLTADCK